MRIRQHCDKTACRSRYYSVYVISVAWMTCSELFHSVFVPPHHAVDDSAILDCQFSDFYHPPPQGYQKILFEQQIFWSSHDSEHISFPDITHRVYSHYCVSGEVRLWTCACDLCGCHNWPVLYLQSFLRCRVDPFWQSEHSNFTLIYVFRGNHY